MSLFDRYFPQDMNFPPTMSRRLLMDRHFYPRKSRLFQLSRHQPFQTVFETKISQPPSTEERVENKMILNFNVPDFKPEEIQVKVIDDNILMVEAESLEKNVRGEAMRKHLSQYGLPKGVLFDNIKSSLSRNGVLTVEIPVLDKDPMVKF